MASRGPGRLRMERGNNDQILCRMKVEVCLSQVTSSDDDEGTEMR